MSRPDTSKLLCQIGRLYDPAHPTCRSCQIGCVGSIEQAAAKLPSLPDADDVQRLRCKSGKPNKTETEYGNILKYEYPGCEPRFEAVSIYLENGSRYTPDWCVPLPGGSLLLVEVKNGAYRHASYGRSKMAFQQCRIDWPQFKYRWAEKFKDGWKITDY